ncbi:MAG: radical SAM protein [Stellaceae bacterium]
MSRYTTSKFDTILSFSRFLRGLELPRAPLEVFLEVSNVCDLKCAMCTTFSALNPHRFSALRQEERGFLQPDEVVTNMEEVLRGALQVMCSGYGEPTVHPDFKEFISFLSQYEVLIKFITNGMHIDLPMAEFLVDKKVFGLMVSFSGITKKDYENTYLGGNFERVLAGVRHIADVKARSGTQYPRIEINSLAYRHHVEHFDRFVEMMADAGADVVYLKGLQPYDHIPELFEHVSIMRPWIEGPIIERAIEIGRARGVLVDCSQYVADQALSPENYEERIRNFRERAVLGLEGKKFGSNPIDTFPAVRRQQHPSGGANSSRPTTFVPLDAPDDLAWQQLEIGRLPELEASPFYCMEPFKTMYVRKNGAVKPCCFNDEVPFLGSIATHSATEIWQGSGYRAFRNAIASGAYPQKHCGWCIRGRVGPTSHWAGNVVDGFLKWYGAEHSPELVRELVEADPDIWSTFSRSNAEVVAALHSENLVDLKNVRQLVESV